MSKVCGQICWCINQLSICLVNSLKIFLSSLLKAQYLIFDLWISIKLFILYTSSWQLCVNIYNFRWFECLSKVSSCKYVLIESSSFLFYSKEIYWYLVHLAHQCIAGLCQDTLIDDKYVYMMNSFSQDDNASLKFEITFIYIVPSYNNSWPSSL